MVRDEYQKRSMPWPRLRGYGWNNARAQSFCLIAFDNTNSMIKESLLGFAVRCKDATDCGVASFPFEYKWCVELPVDYIAKNLVSGTETNVKWRVVY
jgi:hypothetical protein